MKFMASTAEFRAGGREIAVLGGVVGIGGMPVQRRIHILEQPGAHHVDLAAAAFLRRRPVDADLPLGAGGFEPALDRDGGGHGAGAEQVVAAGMAGDLVGDRRPVGDRLLGHAGQRVHLGEDGNDRTVGRPGARHESGRHAGHAGLDRKAGGAQLVLQKRGGLGLLVAEFRRRPDLERDLRNMGRIGVERPD
jgi:hypothetical protein